MWAKSREELPGLSMTPEGGDKLEKLPEQQRFVHAAAQLNAQAVTTATNILSGNVQLETTLWTASKDFPNTPLGTKSDLTEATKVRVDLRVNGIGRTVSSAVTSVTETSPAIQTVFVEEREEKLLLDIAEACQRELWNRPKSGLMLWV